MLCLSYALLINIPSAASQIHHEEASPWYHAVTTKQSSMKRRILSKRKKPRIYLLLEIPPHKELERSKFDNEAFRDAIQHCPKRAIKRRYIFHSWPGNTWLREKMHPIKVAVALGATIDVIELMYKRYPQALEKRDCADILHVALRYNASFDVIQYLVDLCPQHLLRMAHGTMPLHVACKKDSPSYEILSLLIERYPKAIGVRDHFTGSTPLHYLCTKPNASLKNIKLVVENCPSALQTKNRSWKTPLHCASESGVHHEIVQYLVTSYPQAILEKDCAWEIPLHLACENNASIEVIKVLLENCPESLYQENQRKETPVMLAKNELLDESFASLSGGDVLTLLKTLESYLDVNRQCQHNQSTTPTVDESALLMPILASFCDQAWLGGVFLVLDKYPSLVHQLDVDDEFISHLLFQIGKHSKLHTMFGVLKSKPYYLLLNNK